ncbi:MAG: hypothetical protein M9914_08600 [Trueperaceae bacterium]|nr:hypothetical protein [Trueperaceae bacterium]
MRLFGAARHAGDRRLACGRLVLACALALLPLPVHALAGRTTADAATPSMGSPVPLIIVEGNARVPAPNLGLQLVLPPAPSRLAGPRPVAPLATLRPTTEVRTGERLVGLGRLLLDGG